MSVFEYITRAYNTRGYKEPHRGAPAMMAAVKYAFSTALIQGSSRLGTGLGVGLYCTIIPIYDYNYVQCTFDVLTA